MKSIIRPLALVVSPILMVPACMPNPRTQITDATDLPSFRTPNLKVDQSSSLNLANLPQRVRRNHPQI